MASIGRSTCPRCTACHARQTSDTGGGKARQRKDGIALRTLVGKSVVAIGLLHSGVFSNAVSKPAQAAETNRSEVIRVGVPEAKPTTREPSSTVSNSSSVRQQSVIPRSEYASYFSYRFQQLLKQNVYYKLMVLLAFTLPVILFFGYGYMFLQPGADLSHSLTKAYKVIVKAPGPDVMPGEKEGALSAIWLNLAFFIGLFTFAVFLGSIVSDIQDRLNTYRSSSSFQIYEENHALVLNWNRFTLPILRSISRRETHEIGSRFHRKKTVVVIANRDKGEMDREIESFGGFQNLNVIARSGSPMNRLNLESASAGKASEVIVLQDNDKELELAAGAKTQVLDFSQEVGTLLSLNALQGPPLKIVVQSNEYYDPASNAFIQYSRTKHPLALAADVATSAATKDDVIVILSGREIYGRLLAKSALQEDFSRAFEELLHLSSRRRGGSLSIQRLPRTMEGATFGEVSRAYPDRILLGIIDHERRVIACPDPKTTLSAGNRLVVIGRSGGRSQPKTTLKARERALEETSHHPKASAGPTASPSKRNSRVLVLNHSHSPISTGVLHELLDENADITLVSREKNVDIEDESIKQKILTSYTQKNLAQLVRDCDSVLVLQDYSKGKTKNQQDAETQVISLFLFDLFKDEGGRTPMVTFSVHDVLGLQTIKDVFFPTFKNHRMHVVSPEEIIGNLFTAVSQDVDLAPVFHALLDSMILVPAKAYAEGGGSLNYEALRSLGARRGDIVIGYTDSAQDGRIEINPSLKNVELDANAKLIILSSKRKGLA